MSSTRRPRRQVSAAQALGLLLSFVLVAVVGGVVAAGLALPAVAAVNTTTNLTVTAFNELPDELDQSALPEKSTILAADGTTLATFYYQNRVVEPLADISVQLQHAVVATEDKRFYQHTGVDVQGMGRALVLSLLNTDEQQQGASTITQQYVKNVLLEQALDEDDPVKRAAAVAAATGAHGVGGYARKLREAKLAIALEKKESKDQILEGYLNIAQFGASVYGAESAANYYFSTSAKDLTYLQAATIAGITQNPSVWDPTHNPEASEQRRDVVLSLMHDQGYITDDEYAKGIATAIADTLHIGSLKQGCLTADSAVPGSGYFCDYVTKVIKNDPAFGKTAAERISLLFRGGLTIYTTLDPKMQADAFSQVTASIPIGDSSGVIQAMSVVEPGTGRIKAMAQNTVYDNSSGVAGHTSVNFNTDTSYGGSAGFSPGSTFKVFTLLAWLQAGHSLNEKVDSSPSTYKFSQFHASCTGLAAGQTWDVHNSEGEESGIMSVLDATKNSVNKAYAAMATKLDLCQIMQGAADLGVVQAGTGNEFNPAFPSNVLGAENTTPLAMAGAYATFGANGVFCKPVAITKVLDTNNKELTIPSADCQQKVDPNVSATIDYALTQVWKGTGAPISPKPTFPSAGKTGTSQFNQRGWFAGFTPRLAAAVVVGKKTPGTTTLHGPIGTWRSHDIMFGSSLAGPTWARFMNTTLNDGADNPDFPDPDDNLVNGKLVSVPSVIGSTSDVATSTLKAAGFSVVVSGRTVQSVQPAGTVAAQSARKAQAGSTITLTLSNGSPPAPVQTATPAALVVAPDPADDQSDVAPAAQPTAVAQPGAGTRQGHAGDHRGPGRG